MLQGAPGPSCLLSASALPEQPFLFFLKGKGSLAPSIGGGRLEPAIWSQSSPRHWAACYFCLLLSLHQRLQTLLPTL